MRSEMSIHARSRGMTRWRVGSSWGVWKASFSENPSRVIARPSRRSYKLVDSEAEVRATTEDRLHAAFAAKKQVQRERGGGAPKQKVVLMR